MSGLAAISETYGSTAEFLAEGLGLDAPAQKELRRRFVEESVG